MQPSEGPLVYPINDAGARLVVSRSTLYQIIKDGDLPLTKVRGRSFIRPAELEAFVERSTQRARR